VTRAYLTVVPELIGARGRGFYRLDVASGAPSAVAADVSADFLADYEEHGRAGDPVLDFVQCNLSPVDDTRACSVKVWQRSPAHDVLRRAGFYHSLEAPVVVSGEFIGTINFARARDDRPFGTTEMRTASQAAEQLGLAVQRALRFERSGERTSLLEAALDRLPQAVVVTDAGGRIVYTNRAATRCSGTGSSLLDLARPQIADAVAGFRAGSRRIAVGSAQAPAGHAAPASGPGTPSQDAVIVKSVRLPGEFGATLTLIYPRGGADAARLPPWDILSPREQQIAGWVSQGLTTKQIAERAVVTENTVKQHLKRIFAKADVGNRAELVQRVWAAGSPDPGPSPPGQPGGDPPVPS
jgi:DNA-binding CsgD family transcriptional regulator/PAS domain-containing protein